MHNGLVKCVTINYARNRTHLNFAALSAGVVGLTLSYAIKISGVFQQCVKQSAEVENLVSTTNWLLFISDALFDC